MTPLSRRGLGVAAAGTVGVLLTGCGGGGTVEPSARRRTARGGASPSAPAAPGADRATGGPGAVRPVRLRIPAIGVDTPLLRLGLAADGTVEVPPVTDDDRAGWYRYSPVPGRTGPSVILGHVTVGAYGDGVFKNLGRLRPGDRILPRLDDGGAPEFAVTAVRTVAKADFPTAEVYGDVARPELRLITCGGPRTRTGGAGAGGAEGAGGGVGYRDNVIVFAALVA
ncbi:MULTISPECIES: class F sortase [unclassified Streptomyces]|uniref:class F sortase n=1 Tax=unclassified Streptomyces TaxID=2593676 RepID=UPI003D717874